MLDNRPNSLGAPAALEQKPEAGEQRDGAAVETCHHLQEHLLSFTDPSRNQGVNALMDYLKTTEEYDAKCVSLGFPSSQDLFKELKRR